MKDMLRQTDYGKGDFPRKVNRHKYDRGYLRLYGIPCPVCKGKEATCLACPGCTCKICGGLGYVEKRKK